MKNAIKDTYNTPMNRYYNSNYELPEDLQEAIKLSEDFENLSDFIKLKEQETIEKQKLLESKRIEDLQYEQELVESISYDKDNVENKTNELLYKKRELEKKYGMTIEDILIKI